MKESVTLDINIEKGSGLIQKCEALIPPRLQANPAKREMIIFQFRGLGGGGGEGPKSGEKKFSEWGLPGVENVATSLETLFMLSRAPQRPYIKKSKNFEN